MTNLQQRQHGIALIVVLVFLVALTAISLYGAKQAVFGERVARNALDAQVAQQAAEAALRDAEADLRAFDGITAAPGGAACARPGFLRDQIALFNANCTAGLCGLSQGQLNAANAATVQAGEADLPWWPEARGGRWNNDVATKPPAGGCAAFTGGVPLGSYTGVAAIPGVARQPEYLIEYMSVNKQGGALMFRITARGFGYDANTQTMVQSYFTLPDRTP